MSGPPLPGLARALFVIVCTALAYAGTGWLSLYAAIPPDYIAIIFMASGIAAGAVLVAGPAALPGVTIGSLLVQWIAHLQSGLDGGWTWTMAVPALGATLMAWVTARAIRRWIGYPTALDGPREVVLLLFAIVPVCTAINASLSVPALVAGGVIPAADGLFSWGTWWLADTLGAILLLPMMLVLFGRPADAWRPRLTTVVAPMVVAMLLVAGILVLLNGHQQRNLEAAVTQAGQDMSQRLQRRLNAQMDSVEAVGKLMELATDLNQSRFESATRIWLQRYGGTQNFGWSPVVPREQRARYENETPGWPVLGRDEQGRTMPAPDADVHLPITWVVPMESNRAVLGLDVGVLPATARTVALTRASGRPEVTEGFRLVQESGVQRAVVVYLAVRDPAVALAPGEQAPLKGVVSAVFRMDDVLQALFGRPDPDRLQLCLVDNVVQGPGRRLSGPEGCDDPTAEPARWSTAWPLQFGQRDWTLRVTAGPAYWSEQAPYGAWITTAVGLIAVAMLGSFLLVITGQRRRTQRLVDERTHELARTNAALTQMAHYDALTGLANRGFWTQQAEATLNAARDNGKQVAIIFLDLDRFKHVNDSLGHNQGDQLLVTVSARIQECLRARDVLARLGGDEFVALLPWVRGTEGAARVAQKISAALAEPVVLGNVQVNVTASLGVAVYPDQGETVDDLLRHADTAMYAAKAAGRNQWRFFASEMHERVSRRLSLEAGLRLALESDSPELSLVYQPQVDARNGALLGLEALMRWEHPVLGPISPQEFIAVAEESGLIESLGLWVLNHACRQMAQWRTGPDADRFADLTVAINVSPVEFSCPPFVDNLRQALNQHGLPPRSLALEVTETLLVHPGAELNDRMQQITDMGVQLALDDFGTGFSSLGYLKRLPLSKLKIDRSFVHGLPHDAEDEAIIRATLSMAHDLGLRVVAEGVENEAQRDFLLSHGCDAFQGWLFAKAMTPPDLLDWMQHREPVQPASAAA